MNALIELVPVIMVFSIPLVAIIGGYYLKLQKMKLGNGDNSKVKDLQKQLGYLMAENEEIKDRLKNLEYIATDDSNRFSLEYEKEQIRLDKKNK
jgi:hypothetical protein